MRKEWKALPWYKRATQSITYLLLLFLALLSVFLIAQALRLLGVVALIDSLYPTYTWVYLIVIVVTRNILFWGWVYGWDKFVTWGQKHQFFWFKEESDWSFSSEKVSEPDKSWFIFMSVFALAMGTVVGEVVLRFALLQIPPYTPPAQ